MNGILFKPWRIKAIADNPDMEWQFREVIKPQPVFDNGVWEYRTGKKYGVVGESTNTELVFRQLLIPFAKYKVGELVYIMEAYTWVTLAEKDPWKDRAIADGSFRRKPDGSPVTMRYKLDGYEAVFNWETPMFMPAWAARYTIRILGNEAQRVQEISWADCLAEGVIEKEGDNFYPSETSRLVYSVPQGAFIDIWDTTYPKYPWDRNPWVFKYSFKLEAKAES